MPSEKTGDKFVGVDRKLYIERNLSMESHEDVWVLSMGISGKICKVMLWKRTTKDNLYILSKGKELPKDFILWKYQKMKWRQNIVNIIPKKLTLKNIIQLS